VVHLIEAPGIMEDVNDPESLIPRIPREDLAAREKRVTGRMRRKLLALRRLTEQGSTQVVVADGRREDPLTVALEGKGTVIL
jgi:acetylglutamate/LysW-gamma-L-alpha-aminoadipate kinase